MRPALNTAIRHDPFDQWARGAIHAWDFLNGTAKFNYNRVGRLSNTPGWSATPATHSGGLNTYAQTPGGFLYPLASGQLRRIDGRGVLIEGARTNLCLQSQTFDNASWVKSRATISADAAVAPDGTTTADKLVEDSTASNTHGARQAIAKAGSAIAYAGSLYVKAAERTFIHLRVSDASDTDSVGCGFDLTAGTAGTPYSAGGGFTGASASITALANGWWRIVLLATSDSETTINLWAQLGTSTADAGRSYNGDGASGIYLWGAQLEAGAFPSSYVPTVAASSTRAADVLTVPVSGIDYPLSLYGEYELTVMPGSVLAALQIDTGSSNADRALLEITVSSKGGLFVANGGSATVDMGAGSALTVGAVAKTAFRVATNDAKVYTNATGGADTTCTLPATPTTFRFGTTQGGGNPVFGYLRRAALWTRALSDAELQSVTT